MKHIVYSDIQTAIHYLSFAKYLFPWHLYSFLQTIVLELYATFLLQPDLRAFIFCGLPKRTQDSVALFVIFRQIFQIEFFITFCLLSKHSFKSLVAKVTTTSVDRENRESWRAYILKTRQTLLLFFLGLPILFDQIYTIYILDY